MTPRLIAAVLLVLLAGCTSQRPPSPPLLRLSRIGFEDLPGWKDINADAALASFQRSCAILLEKPDATSMEGAGYAGTVADWRLVCDKAKGEAKSFFAENFTPYAVDGKALFTGYYESQIRASRSQHDDYQTPVYGLPLDLVRADLGLFDSRLKGEHIFGHVQGHGLQPYADRQEIENSGLTNAPVLFYTDDPIGLFFLQIQGSGRVVLDDGVGSQLRIIYAGENGRPYTAIGRTLIQDGSLKREDVSLQSIRAWLLAHPDRARSVMQSDKSYVFFQERPLGDTTIGSPGSLGASLTPFASLAVDPRIHALGAPFYVAAQGPDPVNGLLVSQDTGGAIRGPARADIFFGFGPEAENRAGALKASGGLYLLLPDGLAAKIGREKDFAL